MLHGKKTPFHRMAFLPIRDEALEPRQSPRRHRRVSEPLPDAPSHCKLTCLVQALTARTARISITSDGQPFSSSKVEAVG